MRRGTIVFALAVGAGCSNSGSAREAGGKADEAHGPSDLVQGAVITCDFGSDPDFPDFTFGTLEFQVDLRSHDVITRCPKNDDVDCVLDGDEAEMKLFGHSRWDEGEAAGFSKSDKSETNVSQLVITGGNGDDLELTFYISVFPERIDDEDAQAVMIINDGQFINGLSKVVQGCKVAPRKFADDGEACGSDVAIRSECRPGLSCIVAEGGPISEHTQGTCEERSGLGEPCGTDVAFHRECEPGLTCAFSDDGPITEHAIGSCEEE